MHVVPLNAYKDDRTHAAQGNPCGRVRGTTCQDTHIRGVGLAQGLHELLIELGWLSRWPQVDEVSALALTTIVVVLGLGSGRPSGWTSVARGMISLCNGDAETRLPHIAWQQLSASALLAL